MEKLDGMKSYILGATGILATIAYGMSWLTLEQWQVILGILGFGSVLTLRNAIK